MLRDCDNKNDAATTRSNNHKWLYSSVVSNAFAGGSFRIHAAVSTQMPKLATVELHSCILLLSFHSACYLSNSGGFHAIKATRGRSLGGG